MATSTMPKPLNAEVDALNSNIKTINTRYLNYHNDSKTDDDAMLTCWNMLAVETPTFGRLHATTRGCFFGFKYSEGIYGSLCFLKYNGNMRILTVQNGTASYKTVTLS